MNQLRKNMTLSECRDGMTPQSQKLVATMLQAGINCLVTVDCLNTADREQLNVRGKPYIAVTDSLEPYRDAKGNPIVMDPRAVHGLAAKHVGRFYPPDVGQRTFLLYTADEVAQAERDDKPFWRVVEAADEARYREELQASISK